MGSPLISIVHPSRMRPKKSYSTIRKWIENAANKDFEIILSIDNDDPLLREYYDLYIHLDHQLLWLDDDNKSSVDAVNNGAREANGDIIVIVADDTSCIPKWDLVLSNAMDGHDGVLKVFDGVQKWICTMPVISKSYYKTEGNVYHPSYQHLFCDTDLTHKADLQKKLLIRNDIVFHHNHYSTKGGQPKDEVNKKADLTWAQGEKVYLNRCRNKFGLQGVNIYDLSPEARRAGHVNWLKKKLR